MSDKLVDCAKCLCPVQGLKNVARKTARVNPDLIDVDLVRGIYLLHVFVFSENSLNLYFVQTYAKPRIL